MTPVTEEAIALAEELEKNIMELKKSYLIAASGLAKCTLGCTGESTALVTTTGILASYTAAYAPPEQATKFMESIKRIKDEGDYSKLQQECNRIATNAIEWVKKSCSVIDLIQLLYDADPKRNGWQQRMNSKNKAAFAAGLRNALVRLGDNIPEIEGIEAWREYVNQLLDARPCTTANGAAKIRRTDSEPLRL
jgi:hypothetical protein